MSSADSGAPAVRPADVEGWLAELGLTPAERAERDGIASWDLVLDGRRRFDLRVTVILDPALALICWAHYAPPIGDMFRKSYRKLLRWNDEFPFAKFSVAEDERPVLAVELPVEAADADELGLAIARILGIADRLLDESRTGSGSAAGCPTTATGSRQRGAPRSVRRAAAELLGPDDAPEVRAPSEPAPPRSHSRARRVRRRSALLSSRSSRRRPAGDARSAGEVRAAPGSDHRRRRPLRRPAGAGERVRVTVDIAADEPPQRHDDPALLLRPRVPRGPARTSGFKLTRAGRKGTPGDPSRRRPRRTRSQARPRRAPLQRQDRDLPAASSTSSTRAARRPVTSGSATRSSSFPVWAFATDTTPGSWVRVVFPAGYKVEVAAGTCRPDAPPTARTSSRPASSTTR